MAGKTPAVTLPPQPPREFEADEADEDGLRLKQADLERLGVFAAAQATRPLCALTRSRDQPLTRACGLRCAAPNCGA